MPQKFINNWSTVLTGALGSDAGDLIVTVGGSVAALLGTIAPGDFYKLTIEDLPAPNTTKREILTGTARTGGSLTVTRASEPTIVNGVLFNSRQAFSAGAIISARVTAATLEALEDSDEVSEGSGGGVGAGHQVHEVSLLTEGSLYIDGSQPLLILTEALTDDLIIELIEPVNRYQMYRQVVLIDAPNAQDLYVEGVGLWQGSPGTFPLTYVDPGVVRLEVTWHPEVLVWMWEFISQYVPP